MGFENVMFPAVPAVMNKTTEPRMSRKSDLGRFYLQCEHNQKCNHEQQPETLDL